ncbi:Multidrug resistance efflux pump [Devosia crocina]|uniref:Multidrug resistance efflux pump n=1 Tax=Devosia crocina TaxID=429728 RepID=A0A1I7NV13_9HYPH|nr:HlyD family secretion protein [Devosia crocina]SFV38497.1 Multidrug resistance efflux pump [Devosia crocina]
MAQLSPMTEGDIQAAAARRPETRPSLVQAPAPVEPIAGNEAAKPSRSRRKARVFGLGLLAVLGGAIAWYPLSDHQAPFAAGGSVMGDVTQVAARVAGPVAEVLVSDNSTVRAGDPLFRIDDTTFRMDVAQAEAQLDLTATNISSASAAIPATEAKVSQAEVALGTARDAVERTRQMHERGLVTEAQMTQAEGNFETARLNVAAAQAELERVRTQAGAIDDTNPNFRAANAGLEKARFALESSTVLAPADGHVSNLSLTPGQFVAAGSPVMTFISGDRGTVVVDYRENQLVNVQPGDKALVIFEAAPGRQFEATVESIAWGIASGRASNGGLAQSSTDTRWFPPARKIPVRISIDDPSALPGNVRLGSEAGALILTEADGIVPTIARGLLSVSSVISGFN